MSERRRQTAASPAWGHGRALILDAARALFAEQGYTATTTREIAARATVTEPVLFRHFGTKVALFEEAVLTPFNEFMVGFVEDWSQGARGVRPTIDEARDFYTGMFQVLRENKALVLALVGAYASGTLGLGDRADVRLGQIIDRFEGIARSEVDTRQLRRFDGKIMSRLAFSMAFTNAVLDDWLFDGAGGERPRDDDVVEEMAMLTVYGVMSGCGAGSGGEADGTSANQ